MGLINKKVKSASKAKVAKGLVAVAGAATIGIGSMFGLTGCGNQNQNNNEINNNNYIQAIESQQKEIEELKNQLQAILNSNANDKQTTTELQSTIKALQETNNALKEQIADLQKQLASGAITLKDYEAKLADCENLISELNAKIAELSKNNNIDNQELSSYVIKTRLMTGLENRLKDKYARLDVRLGESYWEQAYYCIYSAANGDFASLDTRDESFLQEGDYLYYQNTLTDEEYIANSQDSIYYQLKSDVQYKGYEFKVSDDEDYDYVGYSTDGTKTNLYVKFNSDDTLARYYTEDAEGKYTSIEFTFAYDYWFDNEANRVKEAISQYSYAQDLINKTTITDVQDKYFAMNYNSTGGWNGTDFEEYRYDGHYYANNDKVIMTERDNNGCHDFEAYVINNGTQEKGFIINEGEKHAYEETSDVIDVQDVLYNYSFASLLDSCVDYLNEKVTIVHDDEQDSYSITVTQELSEDEEISVEYTYSFNDSGTYQISGVATDEHGNVATAKIEFIQITKENFDQKYAEVEAKINSELNKNNEVEESADDILGV